MENWYDYPQYFDMIFRDETAAEVRFFEQAFTKYVSGKTQRLLEPGCGSGRLVAAMAKRGYDVTGLDLNRPMLDYLQKRLARRGLRASLILGDMTQMTLDTRFDAAFCTFNTFRHLTSETAAIAHLNSVADHLRSGGIYILGFHCIPLDADEESTERWSAVHGGTRVHVTLRVVDFNRRKRLETLRASIKAVTRGGKVHRVRSEFPLRLYTIQQAKGLLKKVSNRLRIVDAFDFDYDINQPRVMDDDLIDAVFVLQKQTEPPG
ncbi:class I SAM-dependent methyltransferase [Novipirellula artificiosorum]|uniref:Cypemycin methyltransferase n=1 Tax=Novipirellula artificiosorum TaxID=2528016 RepID=A0A5C6DCX6_9BACT|nr:class I SAM-dependent methyltransferase [Novipirellula artificiosorum]TWU35093.1 Cypemycin methyltransferase [Novipirellula artificiosorum]